MVFEGLEVEYGLKIDDNSLKMAVFAPRWTVLGDFEVMLRHVGGQMATKSARMSQHTRQGAIVLHYTKICDVLCASANGDYANLIMAKYN